MTSIQQPENEDQTLQEKLRLRTRIVHLFIQMRQREERDDQERLLELVQTKGQAWVDLLQSLNVTALHVLATIGEHEPMNGIRIAILLSYNLVALPVGSVLTNNS